MVTTETIYPEVLWAQREDVLYMSINVPDLRDEVVELKEDSFKFEGYSGQADAKNGQKNQVEFQFCKAVVPEESKQAKTARQLSFIIKKKDSGPYWSNLISLPAGQKKPHWLKTDFSKWKDEDDEGDDEEAPTMGRDPFGTGMDFSQLAGMGGLGGAGMDFSSLGGAGMGGGDYSDDDEEDLDEGPTEKDLPELEEVPSGEQVEQ
ncbi:hypothetical protein MIR68_007098 [Amoeboaphelidium protococcarum]|nr:hypothetical protein MIR68_007098 [Amoeboaphelidium protococcarum]